MMSEGLGIQEGAGVLPEESEVGPRFLRSKSGEEKRGHPRPRRQDEEWKNTSVNWGQRMIWFI